MKTARTPEGRGNMKMKMDLRELQEAMRRTGADPTTIFYGKANGTLEYARGSGA